MSGVIDIEAYRRDGFTVVEGVFAADKCETFVAYMMDLQAGRRDPHSGIRHLRQPNPPRHHAPVGAMGTFRLRCRV